jgi:putative molybdopterin biosynthesis protein
VIVKHNSSVQRRGYSIREVAEMLGISRRTVYHLISDGDVRTFRVGRSVRIRADDLDRLVIGAQD